MTFSVAGAWTRQSVSLDGSPHFELQRVYWLQAGPVYADLRVPWHPLGGTGCFAGRSGWIGGRYRWTHQLDLGPPGADDVGDLSWEGDRLVERGVLGDLAYEEVWVRLPSDGGTSEAVQAPHACHVQVGDHAITVIDSRPEGGSFNACYRIRDAAQAWRVSAVIGPGPVPSLGFGCVHSQKAAHLGKGLD